MEVNYKKIQTPNHATSFLHNVVFDTMLRVFAIYVKGFLSKKGIIYHLYPICQLCYNIINSSNTTSRCTIAHMNLNFCRNTIDKTKLCL